MSGLPSALLTKWATPFDHEKAKLKAYCKSIVVHPIFKYQHPPPEVSLGKLWLPDNFIRHQTRPCARGLRKERVRHPLIAFFCVHLYPETIEYNADLVCMLWQRA